MTYKGNFLYGGTTGAASLPIAVLILIALAVNFLKLSSRLLSEQKVGMKEPLIRVSLSPPTIFNRLIKRGMLNIFLIILTG
jgi:hypothetical protein